MSAPDLSALLESLQPDSSHAHPNLTLIHQGQHNRVYRLQSPGEAALALKVYGTEATRASQESAKREFGALSALREFGINFAPEALSLHQNALLMTWSEGQPLPRLPDLNDEEMWHRLMAMFGVSGELHLLDYSKHITMKGTGYQNPEDILNEIEAGLDSLDENHSLYETLAGLWETASERIQPRWNFAPQVGLCRRNYGLQDLLWDGHHLLTVDWDAADWGDMAAEVAFWNVHPDYESIPSSHWMWVRWEFAHLTKDNDVVTRATTYAQLGQLWWAVQLTQADDPHQSALRDRYVARAQKIFR